MRSVLSAVRGVTVTCLLPGELLTAENTFFAFPIQCVQSTRVLRRYRALCDENKRGYTSRRPQQLSCGQMKEKAYSTSRSYKKNEKIYLTDW